eukprot:GILI01002980.1.p1 GENE.GILI01002980.1~~GILI01002980.1.p1  ORF type:complete len:521 (+),score=186.80 GILI01002980.1:118-1680(+)
MSYPKRDKAPSRLSQTSVSSSSKISDQRKEKLLSIQKREQLKDLLINKFRKKYAPRAADDHPSVQYIAREVDRFVREGRISEDELIRLEERVKENASAARKRSDSRTGSVSGQDQHFSDTRSEAQFGSSASEQNFNNSSYDYDRGTPAKSTSSRLRSEDDEWAAISRYNLELTMEEERKKQELKALKRSQIKAELDKQIEERGSLHRKFKEDDMVYATRQLTDVEVYKMTEKQKEEAVKERNLKEKMIRDQQLAELRRRRDEEERQRKMEEDALARKIQQDLQAERMKELKKKEDERNYLKRVLEENERNRIEKERRKQEQMMADIESAKEFVRILDKQEASREAALKAREDKQKALMARMKDTVVKMQEDQSKLDAERAMRHQAEREARLKEQEEEKRRKLEESRQNTKAYLESQMRERQRREEEEAEARRLQAEMWRKDTEEYNMSEAEKRRRRKEFNQDHQAALQRQIDGKRANPFFMNTMSDTEKRLNSQLLQKIQDRSISRGSLASPTSSHLYSP